METCTGLQEFKQLKSIHRIALTESPTYRLTLSEGHHRTSKMLEDIERSAESQNGPVKQTSETTTGYPAMANAMVQYTDFMIFQRFKGLSAKNLLYLQAEIVHLGKEMENREIQWKVAEDHSVKHRLNNWEILTADKEYIQLVHKLRSLLKEYSMQYKPSIRPITNSKLQDESLVMQKKLDEFGEVNPMNLESFQIWQRNVPYPLTGEDRNVWGNIDEAPTRQRHKVCKKDYADLISASRNYDKDPATKFFCNHILPIWHKYHKASKMELKTFAEYKDSRILKYTDKMALIAACLLPIAAIVILYFVPNMRQRLGIIAGLATAFAITLMVVTTASRMEIFAGTAA